MPVGILWLLQELATSGFALLAMTTKSDVYVIR